MTDLATVRATIRDTLAHHLALHRLELADLLRYDRGVFALHNHEERLARMIGEFATQIAQGLADLSELGQAAIAWAKADAECDAYIDQSIALAQQQRALQALDTNVRDLLGQSQKVNPLEVVTARAELASVDKQISTVDSLIALACANVTKREAQMKILAKQLAEPDPAPAATITASAPIAQEDDR